MKFIIQATVALFILVAFGCSTADGLEDWQLEEEPSVPHEPSVPEEPEEHPPQEPEETPIAYECPQAGDHSADEDLSFFLYRKIACDRSADENIVFSPAAIRVALVEWAERVEPQEAEQMAHRLGYANADEMIAQGEQYRIELLERKLGPHERYDSRANEELVEVEFEEDDPERLLGALGIEFYDLQCSVDDASTCEWTSQNGRWDDEQLLTDETAQQVGSSDLVSLGIILRGQWKDVHAYRRDHALPFYSGLNSAKESIDVKYLLGTSRNFHLEEGIEVFEWRLLGGDISAFIIGDEEHPIHEIESALFSRSLKEWLEPMAAPSPRTRPRVSLPIFDMEDSVDLSTLIDLEEPLISSTRANFYQESGTRQPAFGGVNPAEPVSTVLANEEDESNVVHTGPAGDYSDEELEQRRHRRLDSPFLFIIYDRPTESVLKMGRVMQP